jgi:hypothetical protein
MEGQDLSASCQQRSCVLPPAFLVAGGDGTSQWLSAAVVAAAKAVVYGVSLYRTVLIRTRRGAATFPIDQAGRRSS